MGHQPDDIRPLVAQVDLALPFYVEILVKCLHKVFMAPVAKQQQVVVHPAEDRVGIIIAQWQLLGNGDGLPGC